MRSDHRGSDRDSCWLNRRYINAFIRLYRPDCVVTSNTSTIPISLLTADMPSDFCARFAITHYFNPVRYMRLLELVSGAETRTDILDMLALFNDQVLEKRVVRCSDTQDFWATVWGYLPCRLACMKHWKPGLRWKMPMRLSAGQWVFQRQAFSVCMI